MKSSDIQEQIARLQAQLIETQKQEAEERREAELKEAQDLVAELRKAVDRLYEIGYLAPALVKALSMDNGNGKFSPGMFIKTPRGLKQAVDAEDNA